MNRRPFTRICGVGLVAVLSGCNGQRINQGDVDPKLDFSVAVERADDAWRTTVTARNVYDWDVSIHDVTILAFNKAGEELERKPVGDLIEFDEPDRTVEFTSEAFPAIVTGTAAESPCDGANIEIQYWVGGTDLQGRILWDSTYQECGEPLPPQRVIEKIEDTPGYYGLKI